jgi:RNA methyltransferase, rsmE family
MQQYFSDVPIEIGDEYIFDKRQAHHAKNVVRLENEKVRIVHDGIGYFATCYSSGKDFVAKIEEKDERVNEIGVELTLAVALIRKEKFELVLQKAAELGVTKIVPYVSSRCVVKYKKEKGDKVLSRYQDILLEASEQCKRNIVPEIVEPVKLSELTKYCSDVNLLPYENAYGGARYMSEIIDEKKSLTIAIGPEGGFSDEEVEELKTAGFETVTLGSRILRAETAAMYACSVACEILARK